MVQSALAIFFIAASVLVRLMPHVPNVAPVIGIGLYSGAYLPKRWAFVVPLSVIIVGDMALGWIPEHLFGWIAVGISVAIGLLLKNRTSVLAVAGAAFASSTLFFLLSNFGVWFFAYAHDSYSRDVSGLLSCYSAGIPFYRNGLTGDLLYTAVLFGSTEILVRWFSGRTAAVSTASK